jgi:hypothetical protein
LSFAGTECFISIVAGCEAARCPYCQAEALQVFLPRTSALTTSRAKMRQEAARQAAAKAAGCSELAQRLAASSSFFCGAECTERVALPATAAPASPSGSLCQLVCADGGPPSPGTTAVVVLPNNLAQLVGAHAQQPGSLVGMLLTREPASGGSSSPMGTPIGSPQSRSALGSPAARSPVGSPSSHGHSSDSTAGTGSSSPAAAPVSGLSGLASPSGGPALLLNPDGTGQLVLLSSEEAARRAEQLRRASLQKAQADAQAEQQAQASYQAPTSVDDQRMQAAIARTDSALRRAQPTQRTASPNARRQSEWLQRLAAADAAVREAVSRVDAQRFGAAGSGGSPPADGGSPPAAP